MADAGVGLVADALPSNCSAGPGIPSSSDGSARSFIFRLLADILSSNSFEVLPDARWLLFGYSLGNSWSSCSVDGAMVHLFECQRADLHRVYMKFMGFSAVKCQFLMCDMN